MGGLRGKLRSSYWLMLVGCLAISGIPPLAGFFSKDDILGRVLAAGNWHVVLWPHLRAWLEREPLDLGALEPYLGLDPAIERQAEQLGLFEMTKALP